CCSSSYLKRSVQHCACGCTIVKQRFPKKSSECGRRMPVPMRAAISESMVTTSPQSSTSTNCPACRRSTKSKQNNPDQSGTTILFYTDQTGARGQITIEVDSRTKDEIRLGKAKQIVW